MTTSKKLLVGLIVLVILGGLTSYAYFTNKPLSDGEEGQSTGTGGEVVDIEGLPDGASVEVIGSLNSELFNNTPRPSLERSLPQTGLPADAYAILKKKRDDLIAEINRNPAAMQNWLALGTVHKQVNDFEGARMYYQYVVTVNPENLTAHWNLGTLYRNYLKDTTKAEASLRVVIKLDVKYTPAYLELASMFTDMKNWTKAEAILKDGTSALPKDVDMWVAQAQYFKLRGDKTQARSAYDKAIALAKEQNNTQLAASLEADKNAL